MILKDWAPNFIWRHYGTSNGGFNSRTCFYQRWSTVFTARVLQHFWEFTSLCVSFVGDSIVNVLNLFCLYCFLLFTLFFLYVLKRMICYNNYIYIHTSLLATYAENNYMA